jgi:hypothetical protein
MRFQGVAPKARIALLIFLLGVGLTFVSLFYKQPTECNHILCEAGEQTAGFPFPVVRDQAKDVGSSPLSASYRVGVEDLRLQDIKPFSFNILFYSAIVWSLLLLRKRLRA